MWTQLDALHKLCLSSALRVIQIFNTALQDLGKICRIRGCKPGRLDILIPPSQRAAFNFPTIRCTWRLIWCFVNLLCFVLSRTYSFSFSFFAEKRWNLLQGAFHTGGHLVISNGEILMHTRRGCPSAITPLVKYFRSFLGTVTGQRKLGWSLLWPSKRTLSSHDRSMFFNRPAYYTQWHFVSTHPRCVISYSEDIARLMAAWEWNFPHGIWRIFLWCGIHWDLRSRNDSNITCLKWKPHTVIYFYS